MVRRRPAVVPGAVLLARRRARADAPLVATVAVLVLLALVATASAPTAVTALVEAGTTDGSTGTAVTVTRSAVLSTVVQVVVLALAALAVAAGLVTARRSVETSLIRSRGGSRPQLAFASLLEGLALVVPAAVVAPWLAVGAVAASAGVGPLAGLEPSLAPRVTLASYLAAAVGGLACLVVLVVPAARSGGTFVAARAANGRVTAATLVRRFGLDLVLLAVAAIGVWQLRRYDGALAPTVAGGLAVDPLLVVTPALVLLAGAVLLLRLAPLVGRRIERAGTRSVVAPLVGRDLGRRSGHAAPGLVLLAVAVAVVVLASTSATSWQASHVDRAVATVGADVHVRPDLRPGAAVPEHLLGAELAAVSGVEAHTAVVTGHTPLPRGRGVVRTLALDSRSMVLDLRADQGPGRVALPDLHAPRPVPAVRVPDGDALTADVTVHGTLDGTPAPAGDVAIAAVVRDGDGAIHRLAGRVVPADGSTRPLVVALAGDDGTRVAAPIELLALELEAPTGGLIPDGAPPADRTLVVTVDGLRVDDGPVPLDGVHWTAAATGDAPSVELDPVRATGDGLEVSLHDAALESDVPSRVRVAVDGDLAPADPLPALATPGLLAATELRVGDVLELRTPGAPTPARIVDTIGYLPGDTSAAAGLVLDLPTLTAHRYLEAGARTPPDAWWLAAADGAAVAAALRAAPLGALEVVTADEVERDGLADPLATGVLGVLAFAVAAATVAAVVGYAAAGAAGAHARTGEVAALRAVGLSRRELHRWSVAGTGVVVGLATAGGTLVGLATALLVVPAVTVTADGTSPVPTPRVVVPWGTATVTVFVALTVGVVVATLAARGLARVPIAPTLRTGEQR